MRLLVSVRNSAEARAALAGGAEIVDAKEPGAGALGAVSADRLAEIRAAVPAGVPLSAALGDVATADDVARAFGRLEVSLAWVKLGYRGVSDPGRLTALLREAVRHAARLPGRPRVIAVAYADHARAGSLPPEAVAALLVEAGADGLLIDTAFKDGGTLLDCCSLHLLARVGTRLAADELTYALGGSLGAGQVPVARAAGATILGVRGSVCVGGRNGTVNEDLVHALAAEVRLERSGV